MTKSYRLAPLLAAPLILGLAACGGDSAGEGESATSAPVEFMLEPVGDANASGEATIRGQGASVVVDVGVDTGQGPGNYPSYIQEGTCEAPGAVVVQLTDVVGAEPGDGEAQTAFAASELSADGTYSLVLEGRGEEPIVCGNIPSLDFL